MPSSIFITVDVWNHFSAFQNDNMESTVNQLASKITGFLEASRPLFYSVVHCAKGATNTYKHFPGFYDIPRKFSEEENKLYEDIVYNKTNTTSDLKDHDSFYALYKESAERARRQALNSNLRIDEGHDVFCPFDKHVVSYMNEHNITRAFLSGCHTGLCVRSLASTLITCDFDVYVVLDLCDSFSDKFNLLEEKHEYMKEQEVNNIKDEIKVINCQNIHRCL